MKIGKVVRNKSDGKDWMLTDSSEQDNIACSSRVYGFRKVEDVEKEKSKQQKKEEKKEEKNPVGFVPAKIKYNKK